MNSADSRVARLANRCPALRAGAVLALSSSCIFLVACASAPPSAPLPATVAAEPAATVSDYGIRVEGLRLTAAGSMVDFRYRVLDAQKAAPILDGRLQPYLLDAARGAKLGVPDTPVLGRMRQTSRNHKILTDRSYFIMFGNPGKALQSGDTVTLLLGQLKITDLKVQ